MKALWTLMVAALAVSFSACASTSAGNRQPTAEEYQALVDQLKSQNDALRRQAGSRGSSQRGPMIQPEDMVPPPAQMRRGRPQNWAWLHQPPSGCESGVYSMEVINSTAQFVQLYVDGKMLRVRGADGPVPAIPPREKVYICLESVGHHTFTGDILGLRDGQTEVIGKFRREGDWNVNSIQLHRQVLEIWGGYIRWY